MPFCGDTYADPDMGLACELPAGHAGDHVMDTGDGDGVWAWPNVSHLVGPEAEAEDLAILAVRSADGMLLDVVAHADAAAAHGLTADGPIGRRVLASLGLVSTGAAFR